MRTNLDSVGIYLYNTFLVECSVILIANCFSKYFEESALRMLSTFESSFLITISKVKVEYWLQYTKKYICSGLYIGEPWWHSFLSISKIIRLHRLVFMLHILRVNSWYYASNTFVSSERDFSDDTHCKHHWIMCVITFSKKTHGQNDPRKSIY